MINWTSSCRFLKIKKPEVQSGAVPWDKDVTFAGEGANRQRIRITSINLRSQNYDEGIHLCPGESYAPVPAPRGLHHEYRDAKRSLPDTKRVPEVKSPSNEAPFQFGGAPRRESGDLYRCVLYYSTNRENLPVSGDEQRKERSIGSYFSRYACLTSHLNEAYETEAMMVSTTAPSISVMKNIKAPHLRQPASNAFTKGDQGCPRCSLFNNLTHSITMESVS